MLEIPESRTICRQLNQVIQGKRIKQVIAGHTSHSFAFFSLDKQQYPKILNGRVVTEVISLGSRVEIQTGGWSLDFEGGTILRWLAIEEKRPAKHQLLVEFTDGTGLLCTVQMYGCIALFKEGEYQNKYYLVAKAKESHNPLSDSFTYEYFRDLWLQTKPNFSIKALLATEQRIPGVGNGVLQDILFKARVNPQSKLGNLNEDESHRIFVSLKETLLEMTSQGGRDTEKDLFGQSGGYRTILSAKTWHFNCPVCMSSIIRKAFLGGNVYFCPQCQPIKESVG